MPVEDVHGNSIVGVSPFLLPDNLWQNDDADFIPKHFIFEGVTQGQGQLVLALYIGNQKVGEATGAYPAPQMTLNVGSFVPPADEESKCVVFVHGFNITEVESTNDAETVFKRLWWRGFKGRYISFRWPTFGRGGDFVGGMNTFNDSEYMAWFSGGLLKQTLGSVPANYTVGIVGHSLGNVVVGEALREGARGDHYAMLHAAVSATCYDNAAFAYAVTNAGKRSPENDPGAWTKALTYSQWLGGIGASPVNFFDAKDSVVGFVWNANNFGFKPQPTLSGGYFYNPASDDQHRLMFGKLFTQRTITKAEAMSYADYTRTGTIGGANNGENQSGGAIVDQVDDTYFGNNHSNEFDWNIQQLGVFYYILMTKLNFSQNYLDKAHPATNE